LNRWVFPVIGLAINLVLGTVYSWSVFRRPLENLCGWSDFESCLPFSVFLFFFAVMMPLGGRLTGLLGPRRTVALGGVMVGLGWFLSSLTPSLPQPLVFMLFSYGVLAGGGVGITYGVPIVVSSRWIPERKGLAVGITVIGFGLSPLITAPLASQMISTFGVTQTLSYLGAAFGLLLVALSLPLKLPAKGWTPPTRTEPSAKKAVVSTELTTRSMLRTSTFKGLWLAYMIGTLGGFIAISLAAKYAEEAVKLTPELAAAATAVFAVFNGAGRPTFGYFSDRLGIRRTAVASFAVIVLAALAATQSQNLTPYLLSFATLWFVFGGWLAIAPAATSTFFGLKNLATNYGVVFTAYGAAALIGPPVAAYLAGSAGGYTLAFLMVAALAMVGLAVSALTLKPAARAEARPIPV